MNTFLMSDKLSIYHLLNQYGYSYCRGKRHERNEERIAEYLCLADNFDLAFDRLFDVYVECVENDIEVYNVGLGLKVAVSYCLSSGHDCTGLITKSLTSRHIIGFDLKSILQYLFAHYEPRDVESMLNVAPLDTKNTWEYVFYQELPEERVSPVYVEKLYDYLKREDDSDLCVISYRELIFLDKYKNIDSSVWLKASRIILDKRRYSDRVVDMYFLLLINQFRIEVDEIIAKYIDDLQLLEEIYLFEISHNHIADSEGFLFKELLSHNHDFLTECITALIHANQNYWEEDANRWLRVYDLSEYVAILDSSFEELLKDSHIISFEKTALLSVFVHVPAEYIEKSTVWIKHYIECKHTDIDTMEVFSDAISMLPEDRRIEMILLLLNLNRDPDTLRRINLFPTLESWNGSIITVYKEKIKFLERLRDQLNGVDFLQHKVILNGYIESFRTKIEVEEVNELLRG